MQNHRCKTEQFRHSCAPLKNNRGVALVMVLLMSALLIALYLRFMGNAGLLARIDARQDAVMQARLAARGAIDYSLALLAQDKGLGDSYTESWKTLTDQTFSVPLMIGMASCAVKVIDESGKLLVNKADEGTLTSLFEFYDLGIIASFSIINEELETGGAARLAQHILDYIDDDESPRLMGAEESTYLQSGRLPPRNGPLSDIRELLNIPGLGRDLFVASGTRPGLEDLLTVYGNGLINLNTAPEGVIRAIPGLPATYSRERLEEYYSGLLAARPFMELAGFTNFIVKFDWRIQKPYTNKFMSATSWFRVIALAQNGEMMRSAEALVFREIDGNCRILRLTEVP